jgi:hypothetical protein
VRVCTGAHLDIGSSSVTIAMHRAALSVLALASLCACRHNAPRPDRAVIAPRATRPAPPSAARSVAAASAGVERWRERWTIEDRFVADIGPSLLVRHDRTSDENTYSLYDRRTGAAQRSLPWLSNALPLAQRTYTERFTFAGSWVSIIEGEPRAQTAVRALETGALAWSRPWPTSVQLFESDGAPLAFVIDHQRSALGVADAATGAWRWSVAARAAHTTAVAITPTVVLSFEAADSDPNQPGTLTARALRDGAALWSERTLNLPHAPVHVRSDLAHTVIAQGNAFTVRATLDARVTSRASVEQRIDDVALVQGAVVVTSLRGIDAFAADTGALLWRNTGPFGCVHEAHDSVFVVVANAEWRELDPRTGAVLWALGGGVCSWDTAAWSRGAGSMYLRGRGRIIAHERSDAPRSIAPLRVHGTVTFEGVALANARVVMGASETVTDAHGRFEFTLRTRGSFGVFVDLDRLRHRAPNRCLSGYRSSVYFEYDGRGGERRADLEVGTFEPNPLTRCAQM